MKTIIVDEELKYLDQLECILGEYGEIELLGAFSLPEEALEFAKQHEIEFAILNIKEENGELFLGKELRRIYPDMVLIYSMEHPDDIKKALYDAKADYYIMKPYNAIEIANLVQRVSLLAGRLKPRAKILTFGHFEVFIEKMKIHFSNAKSKELLALCIDHEGGDVSMEEAVDKLWPNRIYDERVKNLYRKAVLYCRKKFEQHDCSGIFQSKRGSCRILTWKIECDLFQLKQHLNTMFNGEYMIDYEWAREREARLQKLKDEQLYRSEAGAQNDG